jgi:tetratricopeptide (TPR) repeat protein
VRSRLAALGYTFSADAPPAESGRPDPKDQIAALLAQQRAESLMHADRLAEAEAEYRTVVASNPGAIAMRDALADVFVRQGKLQDALEIHRGSLSLPGVTVTNFRLVAVFENKLGLDGWRRSLEIAKEFDPSDPLLWVFEGDLVHMPADTGAALAAYRKALDLDPHCALAWTGICRVEMQRRQLEPALAAAQRATELDPRSFEAWFLRGSMSAAAKDKAGALACFSRARDLQPRDVKTRLSLMLLRISAGDEASALAEMRAALQISPEEVGAAAANNPVLRQLLERAK